MRAIGGVHTPQHIMNLAQAILAGVVEEDVECIVFDYRRERNSYTSQVLAGTTHLLSEILPQVRFRIWPLWRGISNAQIASAVRWSRRGSDTLVLGIYPSGLWARSQLRRENYRTILLDDGASSLKLDFAKLFDDGTSLGRNRVYRKALRALAGRPVPTTATPVLYTAFPVVDSPWPTIKHDYGALRAALLRTPLNDAPIAGTSRVWLDSNYGTILGADCHRAMISSAVQRFGVNTYMPHRRTSMEFAREVQREFGLIVVRPIVPAELVIGPWTQAGICVFTPPASLATTGQFFVEAPGSLTMVRTSEWLRSSLELFEPPDSARFHAQILHAEAVERNALKSGKIPVESLLR